MIVPRKSVVAGASTDVAESVIELVSEVGISSIVVTAAFAASYNVALATSDYVFASDVAEVVTSSSVTVASPVDVDESSAVVAAAPGDIVTASAVVNSGVSAAAATAAAVSALDAITSVIVLVSADVVATG